MRVVVAALLLATAKGSLPGVVSTSEDVLLAAGDGLKCILQKYDASRGAIDINYDQLVVAGDGCEDRWHIDGLVAALSFDSGACAHFTSSDRFLGGDFAIDTLLPRSAVSYLHVMRADATPACLGANMTEADLAFHVSYQLDETVQCDPDASERLTQETPSTARQCGAACSELADCAAFNFDLVGGSCVLFSRCETALLDPINVAGSGGDEALSSVIAYFRRDIGGFLAEVYSSTGYIGPVQSISDKSTVRACAEACVSAGCNCFDYASDGTCALMVNCPVAFWSSEANHVLYASTAAEEVAETTVFQEFTEDIGQAVGTLEGQLALAGLAVTSVGLAVITGGLIALCAP
ncbi:Hypothetical Protein FCC1311_060192 [Hondaea fermentalgiana]|uniref:Apple domain-containing protein n=1 Tax=Hondaea fermentalgiana TaxID=2315210 RepID=A0A2R5GHI4_9STRA|nr:Hypothetical Protein FCC1311_060192 [Hondaea fermentalgiana]|eukprot:GBG29799.1 Hypothetical Protein FCC1311_060192 [Hondaea fermentalgiana]